MKNAHITPRLIAKALVGEVEAKGADVGALVEAALLLMRKEGLARDIPRFLHTVSIVLDETEGVHRAHLVVGFGDPEKTAVSIESALKRVQGGSWHVSAESDGGLLGGVRLRMGDDQIDASVRADLHQLASHLSL